MESFNNENRQGKLADINELRRELKKVSIKEDYAEGSGVAVDYDKENGVIYVDDSMSNTFILSGTGAGKTCTVVLPLLFAVIQNNESAFIHDPKGELYKSFYTLAEKKGYKQIVLDFRDPSRGDSFSVLKMAGEMIEKGDDRGKELLDEFLSSISKSCASNEDPFWHLSAHLYQKKLSEVTIREYGNQALSLKNNMVLHRYLNEKIGSRYRARDYYDSIDAECPEKVNY